MRHEENNIRVGYKPSELQGVGTEYLMAHGYIIAKFFNGNLADSGIKELGSDGPTIVLVEGTETTPLA